MVWPTQRWRAMNWLVGLCSVCGLVGCTPATGEAEAAAPLGATVGTPLFNGAPMQRVEDASPRPPDRFVLTVRMELIPVTVPVGMISRSERLWRYLDEEVADVRTLSRLNHNGFRVGRGGVDEWPAVGKLLRTMTGEALQHSAHLTMPGKPVAVPMREQAGRQAIFAFNGRGELRGRDYPGGDNVLMLTCRLNDDEPDEVLVQAAPLVRSKRKVSRYVKTDDGFELQSRPVETPVEEMEFTVRVPRDHYLVIGPGVAAHRPSSPGNRFLIQHESGLRHETLLVIVPEVYAAPLPREGV